jgi:hypothetical protein
MDTTDFSDLWDDFLNEAAEGRTKPFMEDAHYIAIRDGGKIEFKVAGTPLLRRGVMLNDEQDAVEHIAKAMMDTNILDMNHSSSCDFPDEYDRPDFDYEDFKDKINAVLIANGF